MTLPIPLPYGLRDVRLTPYTDAGGTILATAANTSIDLPNSRTFSFSEAEEFEELEGDDIVVTTHGKGAKVEWNLEAGGISFDAWKVLSGGVITTSGVTPNIKNTIRKKGRDVRPFFRAEGQVISDSGGDVHCTVFRCRATDNLEGEFAQGAFYLTAAGGVGLPILHATNDYLYEFVQNETAAAIPATPVPNP